MEKLYKVKEAAYFLGYHPDHVRRLIRQGKIEHFKAGGQYRFTKEMLIKYLEGK